VGEEEAGTDPLGSMDDTADTSVPGADRESDLVRSEHALENSGVAMNLRLRIIHGEHRGRLDEAAHLPRAATEERGWRE